MKKKITDLFLQIIPVMIGVYLAFVVSNWADQQKSNKQRVNFSKNLKSEILLNKKKLERIVGYHELLRDSANYYLVNNANIDLKKPPNFFRGTKTSSLIKSAYITGNQTGIITEFEIDKIQHLNSLYTEQDEYNEYIRMTLEGVINMDFNEDLRSYKKILQFIAITMTDITYKENQLIKEYEILLNELNN